MEIFLFPSNPGFNSVDSLTSVYIKKSVNDNKILITDFLSVGKENGFISILFRP